MTGETCEHLWSPPAATGRYCMLCDAPMTGEKDAADLCAKNAQVQSAPAEMPGGEEIKELLLRFHADTASVWRHERDGIATFAARAILALFAPILAEKEREIERACANHAYATIGWERERGRAEEAEARALAAEAERDALREALGALVSICRPGGPATPARAIYERARALSQETADV